MMKWWVVSVMLRRWSGWTSALQAARDLYATNNPENGLLAHLRPPYSPPPPRRDVEFHHDVEAYEASLVINLPAI